MFLPQQQIALTALLALFNKGEQPMIDFDFNQGKFIVNKENFRQNFDFNLIFDDLTRDEIALLSRAKQTMDSLPLFYITGDIVQSAPLTQYGELGHISSFAFHNLCGFNTLEDALASLALARRVYLLKSKQQNRDVINIKMIKEHPDALPPRTAYSGTSAAFDLASVEDITIEPFTDKVVPVGVRLSIDEKDPYYMMVHMRSSFGFKKGIQCHQGIIDAGYTGDFGIKVFNRTETPLHITKGEYFAQVVVHKKPEIMFEELDSEQWSKYERKQQRGSGGFGSSGK